MPACEFAGRDPVELLGKRRLKITGAKTGFDMGERDAEIKRRERRDEQRRGVALRHDHVRLMFADHALERCEQSAGENRQRAGFRIDRDALVRLDAEPGERLLGQLGVLAGTQRRQLRMACELQNDRRQLDRLGPRPNHTQKSHLSSRNDRKSGSLWH